MNREEIRQVKHELRRVHRKAYDYVIELEQQIGMLKASRRDELAKVQQDALSLADEHWNTLVSEKVKPFYDAKADLIVSIVSIDGIIAATTSDKLLRSRLRDTNSELARLIVRLSDRMAAVGFEPSSIGAMRDFIMERIHHVTAFLNGGDGAELRAHVQAYGSARIVEILNERIATIGGRPGGKTEVVLWIEARAAEILERAPNLTYKAVLGELLALLSTGYDGREWRAMEGLNMTQLAALEKLNDVYRKRSWNSYGSRHFRRNVLPKTLFGNLSMMRGDESLLD